MKWKYLLIPSYVRFFFIFFCFWGFLFYFLFIIDFFSSGGGAGGGRGGGGEGRGVRLMSVTDRPASDVELFYALSHQTKEQITIQSMPFG